MPSPITALQLIEAAAKLIGVKAAGVTLTAEEAQDGLQSLKDLLENWSIEELSVWSLSNQTFTTVPGQSVYTIGPAGNWNTERPVRIDGGFITFSDVNFPMIPIGQQQFNTVSMPQIQQPIPTMFLYVNENPLGKVTLFPTPSEDVSVTLSIPRLLDSDITLATSLVLPPGYAKALRYNLAVEMAPEYGIEVGPTLLSIATDAKGDIKRANITDEVAVFDAGLVGDGDVALWQRGY